MAAPVLEILDAADFEADPVATIRVSKPHSTGHPWRLETDQPGSC
jgi:hypothetical protein